MVGSPILSASKAPANGALHAVERSVAAHPSDPSAVATVRPVLMLKEYATDVNIVWTKADIDVNNGKGNNLDHDDLRARALAEDAGLPQSHT